MLGIKNALQTKKCNFPVICNNHSHRIEEVKTSFLIVQPVKTVIVLTVPLNLLLREIVLVSHAITIQLKELCSCLNIGNRSNVI